MPSKRRRSPSDDYNRIYKRQRIEQEAAMELIHDAEFNRPFADTPSISPSNRVRIYRAMIRHTLRNLRDHVRDWDDFIRNSQDLVNRLESAADRLYGNKFMPRLNAMLESEQREAKAFTRAMEMDEVEGKRLLNILRVITDEERRMKKARINQHMFLYGYNKRQLSEGVDSKLFNKGYAAYKRIGCKYADTRRQVLRINARYGRIIDKRRNVVSMIKRVGIELSKLGITIHSITELLHRLENRPDAVV